MVPRKRPGSLEDLAVASVGSSIFIQTVERATNEALDALSGRHPGRGQGRPSQSNPRDSTRNLLPDSDLEGDGDDDLATDYPEQDCNRWCQRKIAKCLLIQQAINQLQSLLFASTSHRFHPKIFKECLISLSDLQRRTVESQGTLRCTSSLLKLQRSWEKLRQEIHLEFVKALCYPVLKAVDISVENLGHARWKLHWSVVTRLCNSLLDMPNLETLNLGPWSCQKFSLLADHNQKPGSILQHLPNLRTLKIRDVSTAFLQNLGVHCPKLETLHLHSCEVTDDVLAASISRCHNLESLEISPQPYPGHLTPAGYARVLRSNPRLKSIGNCDLFGPVLSVLYDEDSLFRRSHQQGSTTLSLSSSVEHLNLVNISTDNSLSPKQLRHMVRFCPNISNLQFRYSPSDMEMKEILNNYFSAVHQRPPSLGSYRGPIGEDDLEGTFEHLSELGALEHLTRLDVRGSCFYQHNMFNFLEIRGCQLTSLFLHHIDQMNIQSIVLIGRKCPNLSQLAIFNCYFQLELRDPLYVEELLDGLTGPSLGSTSGTTRPFSRLQYLGVYLTSPVHLPVLQYVLSLSQGLTCLKIDMAYPELLESFVTETLFHWNPLKSLQDLEITQGSNLSVLAINVVLQNCPELQRLGKVCNWKKVERRQLDAIKVEVAARNWDLEIDPEYRPDHVMNMSNIPSSAFDRLPRPL